MIEAAPSCRTVVVNAETRRRHRQTNTVEESDTVAVTKTSGGFWKGGVLKTLVKS